MCVYSFSLLYVFHCFFFFFFKQKTAYEMRISDWSSDVCSSDLHYRIAGMNLLAAIIIFWNTMKLGEVVNTRAASGTHIEPDLLAHVSPLGWEHINLTGEYRWPKSLA